MIDAGMDTELVSWYVGGKWDEWVVWWMKVDKRIGG